MTMQYQIEIPGKLTDKSIYNKPEEAHAAFLDQFPDDQWYYLLVGRPMKLGDLVTSEDLSGAIRENAAANHVDDSFLDSAEGLTGDEVRENLIAIVRSSLNVFAAQAHLNVVGFKVLERRRVDRGDE